MRNCSFALTHPNPIWAHLEADAEVRLAVIGDYASIPTYWRAKPAALTRTMCPTRNYAAVQFVCGPTIVDDSEGKAQILARPTRRLLHPTGDHAAVHAGEKAYGRIVAGHPRVRLTMLRVEAKFKYDDANPGALPTRHRVPSNNAYRGPGTGARPCRHRAAPSAADGAFSGWHPRYRVSGCAYWPQAARPARHD